MNSCIRINLQLLLWRKINFSILYMHEVINRIKIFNQSNANCFVSESIASWLYVYRGPTYEKIHLKNEEQPLCTTRKEINGWAI